MFFEFCVTAIIIAFLCWNLLQDADYVLRFYEAFGKSDENLRGKVAWITGAGSGIGKALALHWASKSVRLVLTDLNSDSSLHWASKSVRLVLTDLNSDSLEKVKSTIGAMKSPHTGIEDVLLLSGDVTVRENHSKWFNSVMNKFGTLDILVNNAGRLVQGELDSVPFELNKDIMDINTMAVVGLTKQVLPHFLKKKSGYVVTTCSIMSYVTLPFLSAYCSSKAAIRAYMNCLRMEVTKENICVTVICPGLIQTNIGQNRFRNVTGQQTLTENYPKIVNPMSSERCAELMSIAVVNRISEAWISTHPALVVASYYVLKLCTVDGQEPYVFMLFIPHQRSSDCSENNPIRVLVPRKVFLRQSNRCDGAKLQDCDSCGADRYNELLQ
ncbi:unnamed protein product [Notodromas monacha]|uniref:Dehydrogenase/reductase SDR family member 7 n=1 Tax=Notodromas monacha TaxID=399045 RepID=A0A7R9GHA1_9CRUS|nr:unnamed protein product [Notodromas monacha]CAG0922566.1 unnamed protein product [Notodromas monacha]